MRLKEHSYKINPRFKKDIKLQIHLHKTFFSLHKSFLNQTTLGLRKDKWTFLNQEFTILEHEALVAKKTCSHMLKLLKKGALIK